jgi:hypothetical protein
MTREETAIKHKVENKGEKLARTVPIKPSNDMPSMKMANNPSHFRKIAPLNGAGS